MNAAPRSRITFATPHYGRSTGGVGVSAERITAALVEKYDIDVIVPERSMSLREHSSVSRPGLTIHRLGGSVKDPRALQFITEYIVRNLPVVPSLVIGFSATREAYAALLGAHTIGCPFIVCGRGDDIDLGPFGEDGWRIDAMLSRADRCVAVSQAMQRSILAISPHSRVCVIPNGVDPVYFPYQEEFTPNQPPTIGLFGELKWKKGLDVLLESMPLHDMRCRIVGSLREESRKLLHGFVSLDPALGARITETPYTDEITPLVHEIHAVDIVCIPSWYDGMPNVLLEAMSCGKIVVASAVGGALDLIREGENGFLFAPGSRESLCAALERARALIVTGPDRVRRCARREIVNHFTWEHEQERYLRLLGEVLEAHATRRR